jgi:pimeloyl-ACP methyl ester carboxylesterase
MVTLSIIRRSIRLCLLLVAYGVWAHSPKMAVSKDERCRALLSDDFTLVQDAPAQVTDATLVSAEESLPSHCRVQGYVAPQVGFELRLPVEGWNRKFLQVGCGGHCGSTAAVAVCPLASGYACISSDSGHKGTIADALWGKNNLQAKVDWGYRAPHVTALAGKAIIERFYGVRPVHSYFLGGSTGGRQALQEAQRFPWDFDGIIAIAPPTDLSIVYMTLAWGNQVTHDKAGGPLLGDSELKLLTEAALASCDLDDGVKDGVIGDPLHCGFDPAQLACKPNQTSGCLNPVQLRAVRKVYSGPMTSSGVKLTLGGPLVGSEFGDPKDDTAAWRGSYIGRKGTPPIYERLTTEGLRYLFFSPSVALSWKLQDFDFDRDYGRLQVMQVLYDATNPDLRRFKAAGGKLMIFQGMNDNSVLPRSTIDYYMTVEGTMGGRAATQEFVRLFLLPGVGHVFGGAGADTIDYLGALEAWAEEGRPPDRLIAAHLKDGAPRFWPGHFPLDNSFIQFTRPVYSYPVRAKYKGIGNPNDASSFLPVH